MVEGKILELTAESAEIAFKQILDDSILKDIPVIGTIFKIYGIGKSIRDRLYTEKIRHFLLSVNEANEEKRAHFRSIVSSTQDECNRLIQKVLLVIESQSDLEKSELIANFFLAYLDGVITSSDFRRALDVTAIYFLDDLKYFLSECTHRKFIRETYEKLQSYGVENLIGSALISFDTSSNEYLERIGWAEGPKPMLFGISSFGGTFITAYQHGANLRCS